jgi:RNA polymerase sigma factor (sigma-70 family)
MRGRSDVARHRLAMLTVESGIDRYFKEIRRFPMLDPQEEYMLAKRWREDGDRDARHAPGSSQAHRQAPGRHRARRDRHEPATRRRRLAQRHSWQDLLVGDFPDQERMLAASEEFDNRRDALSVVLRALNPRERRIFEGRRLADDPITLAELADEFGVSRERVRQIEVRAFEKVQTAVKNRVAAIETPAHRPMH